MASLLELFEYLSRLNQHAATFAEDLLHLLNDVTVNLLLTFIVERAACDLVRGHPIDSHVGAAEPVVFADLSRAHALLRILH